MRFRVCDDFGNEGETVLNNVQDRKGLSAKYHGVENRKGLSPKCHGAGHLSFILHTKCCLISDVQYLPQPPKVGESVCYQGVFFEPQICGWSYVAGRGLHSAVLLAPPGWELTLAAPLMEGLWPGAALVHSSGKPPLLVSGGWGVSERFSPAQQTPPAWNPSVEARS